ncbi:MAG: alpha/beta fold hydrolase [Bacteroidota bacterium]|nr:alpha/beta fold hydrolase [Bacteroidota bacterium]
MKLFYREFGETHQKTLIILHGLYGSSDNWLSLGKRFSETYHVIIPDLRNHGQSPHSNTHNFSAMTEDLHELITTLNLKNTNLLGHSMGGKLAMFFTSEYPELIDRQIIADISPRAYADEEDAPNTGFHKQLMDALLNININTINDYSEADEAFLKVISDKRLRQFMLKNLHKTEQGMKWQINLLTLKKQLPAIIEGFHPEDFNNMKIKTPTLFLRGENSDYIPLNDFNLIEHIFLSSEIVTIPNAGHWLHAEQPDMVFRNVKYFLTTD